MNNSSVKKILILSANPKNMVPLRLDEEVREIDESLKRAKMRDRFELEQKWAVQPRYVQRAILDFEPHIVHFSGHGVGEDGLVFEDGTGQAILVSTSALTDLFYLFADQIECVVLNACYSETQAEMISRYIPYVIGMSQAVGDKAAIAFAVGFYDALGAGHDIEFAYKSGCVAIEMENIAEELIPVLKRKSDFFNEKIKTKNHIESPEGLVAIESRFYIISSYENQCNEEVKLPNSLIRIRSPQKMGKSSLALRVINHANHQGYRTVVINLAQTNRKLFNDYDQFMRWFCASVGKSLKMRVETEEYWDDIYGVNDNGTEYFERYLLNEEDSPLLLVIENFDRVFQHPHIEIDFCALLRGWFDRAKDNIQWKKFRLLIVHSQEPYAKMDINQSPFNIGLPIGLSEFTLLQVEKLLTLHGLTWSSHNLHQFMGLVGGHPYMVRLALYHFAANDLSLMEFLNNAPTEAGIYSTLLRGYLQILEDNPALRTAMKKVVDADSPVSLPSRAGFQLDSMGLIVRVNNDFLPRCSLYRQYFRDRLGVN